MEGKDIDKENELEILTDEDEVKKRLTALALETHGVNIKYNDLKITIIEPDKKEEDVFLQLDIENTETKHKNPFNGWKFHISVDEENKDNVNKAWNVVIEVMLKYKLNSAKFLKYDETLDPRQSGKEITLYISESDDPDLDWKKVIGDINKGLIDAGVKPGVRVFGDKPVKGSPFIYYRFDMPSDEKDEKYVKSVDKGFQSIPDSVIKDTGTDPLFGCEIKDKCEHKPKERGKDIDWMLEEWDMYKLISVADKENINTFIRSICEIEEEIVKLQNQILDIECKAHFGKISSESASKRNKLYNILNNLSKNLSDCIKLMDDWINQRTLLLENMKISGDKTYLNDINSPYSSYLRLISEVGDETNIAMQLYIDKDNNHPLTELMKDSLEKQKELEKTKVVLNDAIEKTEERIYLSKSSESKADSVDESKNARSSSSSLSSSKS